VQLTFVTCGRDGRNNLWVPERPPEYAAACAMGRDYGAELISHIQETGDPSIFGAVIRAMMNCGIYEGAEAGFCSVSGTHRVGADSGEQPRDTITTPTPDRVRTAFQA